MIAPSRYGLSSPVGIEQGRFRIERDRAGRDVGPERHRQHRAVRRTRRRGAERRRRAHVEAGEPGRQASQGPGRARRADGDDPRLREERVMASRKRLLFAGLFAASSPRASRAPAARSPCARMASRTCGTRRTIQYRTDDGPLSASVTEPAARTRVQAMFNVWQNVASASIGYNRAGSISDVGAFTDGDVSTAVEFDAVDGRLQRRQPEPDHLRRDRRDLQDARRRRDLGHRLRRVPARSTLRRVTSSAGHAVMNGLFQDGQQRPVPDLRRRQYSTRRSSTSSGTSRVSIIRRSTSSAPRGSCGARRPRRPADDVPLPRERCQQGTLSIDDVAWISKLYPAAGGSGFAATHGTITGTVYLLGRRVARPARERGRPPRRHGGAADESRTMAASGVSGNRFRVFNGNPINEPR